MVYLDSGITLAQFHDGCSQEIGCTNPEVVHGLEERREGRETR